MLTARKITSNTTFFMTALVMQKLLSFVYFTVLARSLGVESIGQYFFAISFASIFSVLIDLGLTPVLIREVAKDRVDNQRWFSQFLSLKIIFAVITAAIILFFDNILFANDNVRTLIMITTAIVIVDSFTLMFYGFIRGMQNLRWESWGTIIFQVVVLGVGLTLLQFTKSVGYFLGVLLLASTINLVFATYILKHKFHINFSWHYSKDLVKRVFVITLPFALAAIFAKVYAYIDTFFLKIFIDDLAVGYYSVAYKITFAFQFIPLAFVAALYPAFSNYGQHNKEGLQKTFVKSFNYLAFIALPIALGIISIGDEVIRQLYTSEFHASVMPLQILMISIPFLFVNFSLSSFLNAADQQKINTINLGIVMAVNVILNILLIQAFGITGAAMASTISTVLLFTLNLIWVYLISKFSIRSFFPIFGSIVSGMLMFVAVIWFKQSMHWVLAAAIGALIYVILMFLTKSVSRKDVQIIINSFKRTDA